jgi:hypothetical protein
MSQAARTTKRPDRSVKTRTPLGARNRLSFTNLDKRFNYRVINDQDDRLARAEDAGYEFVESDEKLGDTRVAEGTVPGSRVAKPVGNNVMGYLMRIPVKFYKEDQAAKAAKIQETEDSMQPDKSKSQYGGGLSDQ